MTDGSIERKEIHNLKSFFYKGFDKFNEHSSSNNVKIIGEKIYAPCALYLLVDISHVPSELQLL